MEIKPNIPKCDCLKTDLINGYSVDISNPFNTAAKKTALIEVKQPLRNCLIVFCTAFVSLNNLNNYFDQFWQIP